MPLGLDTRWGWLSSIRQKEGPGELGAFNGEAGSGRRNRVEERMRLVLDTLSLRCGRSPSGDVWLAGEAEAQRRGLS